MKKASNIIITSSTYLFVVLFVYTGVCKLLDHRRFFIVVQDSDLIHNHALLFSYLIPISELMIGAFLLFPRLNTYGLILSAILMAAFTYYVYYTLNFQAHIPCSCGGIIEYLPWKLHLKINAALTALAIAAIILKATSPKNQTYNDWSF